MSFISNTETDREIRALRICSKTSVYFFPENLFPAVLAVRRKKGTEFLEKGKKGMNTYLKLEKCFC